MRKESLVAAAMLILGGSCFAAEKPTRFWNLTANTITSFQLAPARTEAWGRNQCENDRDGAVDHDERLRITGVAPGRYDAKLTDKTGRICVVGDLDVQQGAILAIEEKSLKDCRR